MVTPDLRSDTSTAHKMAQIDLVYLHTAIETTVDADSPEKAEDAKVLGVDCNVDDHIAVTSTGRFVGNADYLNHERREFEKRRESMQ